MNRRIHSIIHYKTTILNQIGKAKKRLLLNLKNPKQLNMKNNTLYNTFVALLLICCSSCNNSISKTSNATIRFTADTLSISNVANKNITISVHNENVISYINTQKNSIIFPLLDVIRKCKNKNETALQALKNNNALKIRVVVENEIDTTYSYNIVPYYDEDAVFAISGQCAPLISTFSNPKQTIDIKKWLFRKKEYLNNKDIRLLSGLINQLSKTGTTEYITNATLPVIRNFSGLKYKVKSSIVADYYVLYACSSAKEAQDFVEDVISNDFDLCSKSLDAVMDCYRETSSNGYKCICLVAINNDWSYKIQPLGLVAIDNMAPVTSLSLRERDASPINFPNNIKVVIPSNKPMIDGICNVSILNWDGNVVICNVTFSVLFAGDVKSVTVKRTKKLSSREHMVENKVIELKEKSNSDPMQRKIITFSYMLHFTEGDNYIPIIVEDNHGNKHEFELEERAEFVWNNSPSINIDNNINIDTYKK